MYLCVCVCRRGKVCVYTYIKYNVCTCVCERECECESECVSVCVSLYVCLTLHQSHTLPPSPASQPSPSMSPLNPANLTSWSVDDVSQWLVEKGLGQFIDIFRDNLVDGECLMVLDNTLLKEDLGITALGHRSRIVKRVNELKSSFEPLQAS